LDPREVLFSDKIEEGEGGGKVGQPEKQMQIIRLRHGWGIILILIWVLKQLVGKTWIGSVWLRTGKGGRLLRIH
jgi:hypothetical protein